MCGVNVVAHLVLCNTIEKNLNHPAESSACSFGWWLMVSVDYICYERKIPLAGWWMWMVADVDLV
jgi:hypothetical protein